MLKKLLLFIFPLIFISQVSASEQTQKAEAFMQDIGQEVINLLTDKTVTQKQRANHFRAILKTKFDVKAIGKFALGKYWRNAAKQEKDEFFKLFEDSIVSTYSTRFQEYTSEKFRVKNAREESNGGVTVRSEIVRLNGSNIPIDWIIFEKKGQMRIYDVILDGISMSITQRSEYASVIQRKGGKVQGLNDSLRDKLSSD